MPGTEAITPAMARRLRIAPGGLAYHVLNRRAGRARLFDDDGDYEAFLRVLVEVRVCSFVLMPNHWHLVLWPRKTGDLSAFRNSRNPPLIRAFRSRIALLPGPVRHVQAFRTHRWERVWETRNIRRGNPSTVRLSCYALHKPLRGDSLRRIDSANYEAG
jgi:REP element-mobilizing transposase RayT